MAAIAGWHESKCSRIEHARTPPSDADIRAWCRICAADDAVADLIAASRAADSTWTQWQRLERPGLRRIQESVIPLWEGTRQFRIYSPFLIPGPVQTAAYIRALLKAVRDRRPNLVDDIEQAAEVRVATQHVTRDGDHRFTIVLEENVLRHQIGGPAVLREQLEYLRSAMSQPSVTLGVIPFSADRSLLHPVWARMTAPALSFLLLGAVVVLAVLHYATLLGVASGSPASWILPASYAAVALAGLGWAAILRSRRPHIYATIGLGANAVTAQSTAVPGALS